jgi:hypothetical protein
MTLRRGEILSLPEDETGQATLEFVLLTALIILPIAGFTIDILLDALSMYYRMLTFFETFPFP